VSLTSLQKAVPYSYYKSCKFKWLYKMLTTMLCTCSFSR